MLKTIGFIVFSFKNVKKPLVLLCFRSKMLKNYEEPLQPSCLGKKEQKPLVLHWFFKKRVVKPISSHGFGPWSCNTRQEKLWGTLTDKLFREPLVLLCFRSKMLKNHWFYCVFAQKCWKTIGFTSKEAVKQKKTLVYSVSYVNED